MMDGCVLLAPAGGLSLRARQLQAALGCERAERAGAAAVVVWAAPWTRTSPLPVLGQAVHVLDLHDALAACPGWGAAAQRDWVRQVAALCRGAALLLVGSEAALGFWSAALAEAGVSAAVAAIPYAGEVRTEGAKAKRGGKTLRVTGSVLNPALRPMLQSALGWARENGFRVEGGPDAAGVEGLAARTLLPDAAEAGTLGGAGLLLDLRENWPGERAVEPAAVIEALAAGACVASTVDGALGRAIAMAGAGVIVGDRFAAPTDLAAAQAKAQALARSRPGAAAAAQSLQAAVGQALERARAARAAWARGRARAPTPLGPGGRVLVLSEEAPTLHSVRVQAPFGALHRRGAIGGYAVLRGGEIVFDTHAGAEAAGFDAIWVHRSMDPSHRLLLRLLGRAYAYDIDDNLLAAPSYREAFYRSAQETAQDLLQEAAVVSCATERLAGLLGARAALRLADRTVVTRNLGQERPAAREAGAPRALIWASSDRPALTQAREAVVRAIRDHCLAHRTKLVCIGAPAPEALAGSGVEVQWVGMLPHEAYREHLRGLSPSILVCPLETGADRQTQDFIDGKSDIKAVEALSYGLVGAFSRAQPYLDSDLPGGILCENSYEGWLDGLEAARAACLAPELIGGWPEGRDSAGFGLAPWAAALERARLPARLPMEELQAALDAVSAQEAQHLAADAFDEAYYLSNYEDVRLAVKGGVVASGFAHYEQAGREEGRYARRLRTAAAARETWWSGLLHEVAQMEAGAARRAERLGALERRLALRQALAR